MLMGFILFVLEIKIISYGLLTIGGIVCLFLGSTILFKFGYGIKSLPLRTILPSVIGIGTFISVVLYLVTKVHLKPSLLGQEAMINSTGEVIEWEKHHGKIKIRGEIWKAECIEEDNNIQIGTKVKVVKQKGLTLIIKPL